MSAAPSYNNRPDLLGNATRPGSGLAHLLIACISLLSADALQELGRFCHVSPLRARLAKEGA